ncbi:MAG: hypothetical protein LQ342_007640 [Letrouitia transgressa]|nr:MAG: hypothetical protein LQ342_007640 [Letrouitia transgressa]
MSYENFQSVLRPKVQGSWNLHKHLPKGLDFFVLLSSTGGVFGSRGQSNYATANTYQDSLARYRVSQGEKCISLNLGLMLEVGFAAERQQVMDSLKNAGYEGIQQAELLAMLDHYCEPSLPIPTLVHSQVVTGLSTPASIKRKGATELFWMSRPLFQSLRQVDRNILPSAETDHLTVDYKGLLSEAESLHQAGEIVARALIKKLAMALSMPEADVTIDKSVSDYGVDSLVAVEIRYWFLKEFMVDLAVFNILGSEDILHLGILAAQKSTLLPAALKFDG